MTTPKATAPAGKESEAARPLAVSLYDYADSRAYLKDWYRREQASERNISRPWCFTTRRIPREERVLAATTVSISRDTSGHFILAVLPHGTYTVRVQAPSQTWSAIELPQVRIHTDSLTSLDTVVMPNAVPGIFAHWR